MIYVNNKADEKFYNLIENLEDFPFSFIYNEEKYKGFSEQYFKKISHEIKKANQKETHEISLLFANELTITLIITHYFSHGVSEWTVWFENSSTKNSGIIESPTTEITFYGKYPELKGILGDYVNQYQPYAYALKDKFIEFSSDTGRATHRTFPYFNLEHGDDGTMLAIGWAGTWNATFYSDGDKTVYTASSVNMLKTYLKPQEKIRTALFVVAPYTIRDEHYATNFWRDWFIKHNLPKQDSTGKDMQPFSTCWLASDTGLPNSDGSVSENHTTWRPSLEKMLEENVHIDYRWFDAGWYVAPNGNSAEPFVEGHDWWDIVGTWELDPVKWPDKTFLESTDFAREHGMKTLVWFEPERTSDPENLAKNYGYNPDWAIRLEGRKAIINNLGNKDCLAWTTDRICKMLKENKVELYREDNNTDAIALWTHLDNSEGENRKGITENKFIIGHYKMWDDIIACTLNNGGNGFVDSCASGGGRNDLESMRRGVPLLRSDSDRTSTALRLSMTTAFNKWIPFCGANTKEKQTQLAPKGISDKYVWRASYLPALNVDSQFVQDPNQDFDILRFGLQEWKKITPFLLKDFYTLTPWHKEKDTTDFTALCYIDPETEKGVLLAFRQENCPRNNLTLHLPFIKNGQTYQLTDEDTKESMTTTGKITLSFDTPRSSKLIWINKIS